MRIERKINKHFLLITILSMIILIVGNAYASDAVSVADENEPSVYELQSVELNAYATGNVLFSDVLMKMTDFIPDGINNAETEICYTFGYTDDNGENVLIEYAVEKGEVFVFDEKIEHILEDKLINVSVSVSAGDNEGEDTEDMIFTGTAGINVFYPYVECVNVKVAEGETVVAIDGLQSKTWHHSGVKVARDTEFIVDEPVYKCEYNEIIDVLSETNQKCYQIRIFIGEEEFTSSSTVVNLSDEQCIGYDFHTGTARFDLHIYKYISGCDPEALKGMSFVYEIESDEGEIFYEVLNFLGDSDVEKTSIIGIKPGRYTVRELTDWSYAFSKDPSDRATGFIVQYPGIGGSMLDGNVAIGMGEGEGQSCAVTFYSKIKDKELYESTDYVYYICNEDAMQKNNAAG
ncbi:MAG: hypothetical protein E7218_02975 [Anaerofustis stercorihominis]|nr:hypothetical protein [Anaerofustis stercorihominis]